MTCAFGRRFPCGPCIRCQAFTAQMREQFARRVFFGEFDWQGYTPNERAKVAANMRATEGRRSA